MSIDVGGKAEELQTKIIDCLTKLGFLAHRRAEGFAFFPGEEQGWLWLPNIRLARTAGTVTIMIHASDALTTENAAAVRSTAAQVYELIIKGVTETGKLYEKYGKKASYVSINNPSSDITST